MLWNNRDALMRFFLSHVKSLPQSMPFFHWVVFLLDSQTDLPAIRYTLHELFYEFNRDF